MNPMGHVQDINSLRKQGYVIESALSPDVCLEIVKDLNSPKGKGMLYTVQGCRACCVIQLSKLVNVINLTHLEITSSCPYFQKNCALFKELLCQGWWWWWWEACAFHFRSWTFRQETQKVREVGRWRDKRCETRESSWHSSFTNTSLVTFTSSVNSSTAELPSGNDAEDAAQSETWRNSGTCNTNAMSKRNNFVKLLFEVH